MTNAANTNDKVKVKVNNVEKHAFYIQFHAPQMGYDELEKLYKDGWVLDKQQPVKRTGTRHYVSMVRVTPLVKVDNVVVEDKPKTTNTKKTTKVTTKVVDKEEVKDV